MRLILDNVSEKDYQWLTSMAKALNFKVAIEEEAKEISLDEIDKALDKSLAEDSKTDFSLNFGIEENHIKEFQERKEEYLSGKSQTTSWSSIKKEYGLL
jgi:hypothetical protein